MSAFEKYMQIHNIDPIQLSIQDKVRYLTVWKAMKGIPIKVEHAI